MAFKSWEPCVRLYAATIHVPVKTPKWLPRLIFCRGMSRPVNWYRDYVIKPCDTSDMTCEHVSRQGELWSFFPCALSILALALDCIPHLFRRFQTIFDRIKTELSVGTETINQTTRPGIASALLIYSFSCDRLTAG